MEGLWSRYEAFLGDDFKAHCCSNLCPTIIQPHTIFGPPCDPFTVSGAFNKDWLYQLLLLIYPVRRGRPPD